MTNYIYLVAGERNTKPGAVSDSGGLYANVGMTHNGRLPEDRFRDPDYKKKQSGGSWVLLKQWAVGDMKDHSIHNFLKRHDDVRWNPISHNTEEFLFVDDEGDGLKAINIIEHIMLEHLMPPFIKEKLSATQAALTEERNKREHIENAEPWLLLQEALVRQEEAFKIECDKRRKALERDNDIHLALKEAQLRNTVDERLNEAMTEADERLNRAMTEAKQMVELAQKEVKTANDTTNALTQQRDQAIAKSKSRTRLSVLSMSLGFVCALSLGTEAFSNMANDEIALAEHQVEKSNQAMLASNSKAKELELEINNQTSSLEALVADYSTRLDPKSVCLRASECTAIKGRYNYDIGSNEVVCSVKVRETYYTCKYTLKIDWQKEPGYQMINSNDWSFRLEGHTVTLKDGKAHLTNAPISSFRLSTASYKITKYEAYGTPQ